jgi:hypothetical protein
MLESGVVVRVGWASSFSVSWCSFGLGLLVCILDATSVGVPTFPAWGSRGMDGE